MAVVAGMLGITESKIKTEQPNEDEKKKVATFIAGVRNGNLLRKGTYLYKVLSRLVDRVRAFF